MSNPNARAGERQCSRWKALEFDTPCIFVIKVFALVPHDSLKHELTDSPELIPSVLVDGVEANLLNGQPWDIWEVVENILQLMLVAGLRFREVVCD